MAEDTFGVEMFIQMAISAPLAMLCIALLMWLFFRNVRLVVSGLAIAMISVMITMGAFITSGQTLHIMSSMIPIFIMPIAVLDAIHVLSRFHGTYDGDRRAALEKVMKTLWSPMLYTTLTTAVGFLSLSLAPIPPVQVFGVFTAFGILVAWVVTMTFLPAYIAIMPEAKLKGFGAHNTNKNGGILHKSLQSIGNIAWKMAPVIVLITVALFVIAGYGISKIKVNDNPIKWFEANHQIRKADDLINQRFGGSYITYLSFMPIFEHNATQKLHEKLNKKLAARGTKEDDALIEQLSLIAGTVNSPVDLLNRSRSWINQHLNKLQSNQKTQGVNDEPVFDFENESEGQQYTKQLTRWIELDQMVAKIQKPYQIMKNQQMLKWLDSLVVDIVSTGLVSRGNSAADLVKKINKELHEGLPRYFTIPGSQRGVAETYITYQNSHDPQRLWHLMTRDYASATLWLQLKSGDNIDVDHAVQEVNRWIHENPAPYSLEHKWFGLSYINILWQQKMVNGMLYALATSACFVFVLLLLCFRSFSWAIISLIPLAAAITAIYGVIGLIGQDYDMPVAILSALALGLAIDFAIHFVAHLRVYAKNNTPHEAIKKVFGAPSQAILRNAIIVALGFTPLLLAPLIPYQKVGILMASILLTSALATFLVLPAILRLAQSVFFTQKAEADTEFAKP